MTSLLNQKAVELSIGFKPSNSFDLYCITEKIKCAVLEIHNSYSESVNDRWEDQHCKQFYLEETLGYDLVWAAIDGTERAIEFWTLYWNLNFNQ